MMIVETILDIHHRPATAMAKRRGNREARDQSSSSQDNHHDNDASVRVHACRGVVVVDVR